MAFEGAVLPKAIERGQQKWANTRQAEILNKSFNAASAASHTFSLNYEKMTAIVKPLAKEYILSHKTLFKDLHQTDQDADIDYKSLFSQDLKGMFTFAQGENFLPTDLQRFTRDAIAIRLNKMTYLRDHGFSIIPENASHRLRPVQQKLERVLEEVKKFGLPKVDHFYEIYPQYKKMLGKIKSEETLIFFENKAIKELKRNPENNLALKIILNDVSDLKNKFAESRRRINDERKNKSEKPQSKDEEINEYKKLLNEAIEYIKYSYPGEKNGNLIVESLFKSLRATRDLAANAPIIKQFLADCPARVKLFWLLRTGRPIDDPKKYGLSKGAVDQYEKFIFDGKLHSEAGAWWFTHKDNRMQRYFQNPNEALINSIESFLKIPPGLRHGEEGKNIKIMIIVNDNTTLKFSLDPNSSREQIVKALNNPAFIRYDDRDLPDKKRYKLKAEAYKPNKRSMEYEEFYAHHEPLNIAGRKIPLVSDLVTVPVDGDFIFRLTTKSTQKTKDINSPFNLFTVDSHKALIDLDFSDGSENSATISMKFSHTHYDADNQRLPFEQFMKNFRDSQLPFSDESPDPTLDIIAGSIPINRFDKIENLQFPLFEAVAETSEQNYKKIVVEKDMYELSPNLVRGITTALSIGATDFFNLQKAPQEVETKETYDNIQPTTISLSPIMDIYQEYKKRYIEGNTKNYELSQANLFKVIYWIEMTNRAIKRSKEGRSYQAIMAAPTGRLEGQTAKATKLVFKPPTILTEGKMMFSDLVDINPKNNHEEVTFVTASTDANGSPVDLKKDQPNGGAIGYIYSVDGAKKITAVSTCRKTPRQAQAAFKRFFSNEPNQLFENDLSYEKKIPAAIPLLNDLIYAWENLSAGKITYDEYEERLSYTYHQLLKNKICGKPNLENTAHIYSPRDLQYRLNQILKEDAGKTLDQQKIAYEKVIFESFMAQVAKKKITEVFGD